MAGLDEIKDIPIANGANVILQNAYTKCGVGLNFNPVSLDECVVLKYIKKSDNTKSIKLLNNNMPFYPKIIVKLGGETGETIIDQKDIKEDLILYIIKNIKIFDTINPDNLLYANEYLIGTTTIEDSVIIEIDNRIYFTNKQYIINDTLKKKCLFYILPNIIDSRTNICLYGGDINSKCYFNSNNRQCDDKMINYCSKEDRMFTKTCQNWRKSAKNRITGDPIWEKTVLDICKRFPNKKECRCVNAFVELKDKELKMGDEVVYPHCIEPACDDESSLKLAIQENFKCPSATCSIEDIKVIIDESYKKRIVQICKETTNNNISERFDFFKIVGYVLIAIVVIIIIVNIVKK